MKNNQFSSAMWTCLMLDQEMHVLETTNFDSNLFFGKTLALGMTISQAIEQNNSLQIEKITKNIRKALQEKRNSCFVYLSTFSNTQNTHVCAHVEYCNDKSVCLYLTALYAEDLEQVQQNINEETNETSQDITDFAQLKKKYENLYNQYITILKSLPIGIGVYSNDGTLLYINQLNCQIFGIDPKEVMAKKINVNESPALPQAIKDAVRNGTSIHMDFPYDFKKIVKTGYIDTTIDQIKQLEFKGEPIVNATGEIGSYIFTIEDITEKLEYEKRLRQNQHKTEIAMKVSDIMIWEFDVKQRLFFSDNEPMNGYDVSKPLTIEQYIKSTHFNHWSVLNQTIQKMSEGEEFSFDLDLYLHLPNNPEWQYCSVNGSPYEYDSNGRVIKYVGIRKNNTILHKRKQLQDKILNSIPLSIHIKDVENNYQYLFCNDESKRLFGTSENKSTYDVMDKEDVKRIQKTDLDVFNTGKPYLGLERVKLKDGRNYDTIVQKSIINDNGKDLLLSIRWDESMQNNLKRRSKLLSLSLEAMDAFTWSYEPDQELVNFEDGFDKMGKKASEINTLNKFITCIHPDDVHPYIESLNALVEKDNGSWRIECRLDLNGDGVYKWWEARGMLETTILNDVPYKYLFGMSVCIDPYKQAELKLLKNKKELDHLIRQNELILNNTNSGLAYITTDYIVQWENVSMCSESLSFEAYKKGEFCYKSAHNRTSPCENCVMQRALVSGQTENIQFGLENNRRIEVFATPVLEENNVIDGIVIRVDDITERQQMIEELRDAKIQAEQSDKLKSAFLANMSHEIRTPLNAIVGFSELMMSSAEEKEKEEYMNIINNNNELLLKLINDILDLSKIEAGSIEFIYEEFDLSEYFNVMTISMHQRLKNSNIQLLTTNPYTNCKVKLDKNRVAQLMTNYITNAIKYTPKGYIEVGYECSEKGIRFYVKDSGIGISDEKKEKVFHRFAKLDEFAQGTGLGLSICKAIAESMGGSVGFDSEFGKGSLFWAFLPCEPDIKVSISETDATNEHHIESTATVDSDSDKVSKIKKTILIAEDIQSNFLLLSAILKKDYNLLHALNGQQAVDMAKNTPVDLVFMDMKMPLKNGLEATAEIRTFNTQLPIVALTAHAFESDRLAAIAAGCNDFLVKPINKALLRDVLQKYCPSVKPKSEK